MNSLTKATIATAAGVALFLGGAGSLALWNDSASLGSSGSITDGQLTIAADGTWNTSGPAKWVPGDCVTYTATVDIVAQGDNLHSQLSINPASITDDAELLSVVDIEMTVGDVTGGSLTETGAGTDVYTVVADNAAGTITADVTATLSLPATVSGLTAQGQSASLGDLALLRQQV